MEGWENWRFANDFACFHTKNTLNIKRNDGIIDRKLIKMKVEGNGGGNHGAL